MIKDSPSVTAPARRLPAVDGLRTAAVAVVVAFHMFPDRMLGGAVGVDVFFVISGFVITGTLLREKATIGRIRVGAFYVRRWLRLMPALALVSLTVAVLSVWQPRGLFVDKWRGALFGVTYTMNLARSFDWASAADMDGMAHTWSLGIEEQFYLLWPVLLLLILAVPRRVGMVIWGLLLAIPSLVRIAEWSPAHYMAIYDMPQTRFDQLLVGAALAFVVTRVPADQVLRVARPLFWPCALLLVYVAFAVPVGRPDMWSPDRLWGLGPLAISLVTAVVIARLALDHRGIAAAVLGSKPISTFGRRYSYGVYLWHYVVLYVINSTGTGGVRRVVLLVPTVAVLAYLSYRFIERPALHRKRRYETATLPALAGAGAPADLTPVERPRAERHSQSALRDAVPMPRSERVLAGDHDGVA